jgi:NAD(P)-dependent dehydrogenase (short-subunit alcohol dehydrogenase family)
MIDLLGLEGKVAMVVGGGLGMGHSTSLSLAKAGCDVAVIDVDRERAEFVAAEVRETGRRGLAIVADALDPAAAAGAVATVESEFGRVDRLATIVGQAAWTTVLDVTEETWDLDHRRNLRYFFFVAQAAARAMIRGGNGGAIAAVASVSGIQSAPNHAPYGAAKAGLINLVRTMGVELAPHGIRVNAIAPGTIKTPRTSQSADHAAFVEKVRNSLIPFRRLGETQDIANGLLFMLSDLASFVTGQTLAVDGGFTAQFLLGAPREA